MLLTTPDYPAIFRWEKVLDVVFVFDLIFLACLFHLFVEPQQNALSEQYAVVILLESHVVNTPIINREYLPVRFDLHFQLSTQVQPESIQDIMQPFFACAQHYNIIHVPKVVFHTQHLLCPMVEVGQIEVSQILTCEVAYWQSLCLTVTINNLIQQPQHLLIGNRVADNPL